MIKNRKYYADLLEKYVKLKNISGILATKEVLLRFENQKTMQEYQ